MKRSLGAASLALGLIAGHLPLAAQVPGSESRQRARPSPLVGIDRVERPRAVRDPAARNQTSEREVSPRPSDFWVDPRFERSM